MPELVCNVIEREVEREKVQLKASDICQHQPGRNRMYQSITIVSLLRLLSFLMNQKLRSYCPNVYTVIFCKELRFIDANALKIIRLLGLLPPLQRPKKDFFSQAWWNIRGPCPK